MHRTLTRLGVALALLASLTSAGPARATPVVAQDAGAATYLLLTANSRLPAGLSEGVSAAGGTVLRAIPEIGVLVAASAEPAFPLRAADLPGVWSVAPNVQVSVIDPGGRAAVSVNAGAIGDPPFSGDDDFYYDLQWGHAAVNAPQAWNAGRRGAGARVAILDTGFDLDHVDLAPNINLALSASFVPDEGLSYALPDAFSHGAQMAGIVAAADNAFGLIGVAPEAELVLVKVLRDTGVGEFDWLLQGIVYAAEVEADVINLGLGALLPARNPDGSHNVSVAVLRAALARAAAYAFDRGATLIAAAGNDSHNGDADDGLIHLPSDAPGFISVAATGPLGWALDPHTDLDIPAHYTNYGVRAIDFAAPGGNVDFDLLASGRICTLPGVTAPCSVFDLVLSTGSNLDPGLPTYFFSSGTSLAAAYVSGVAALLIGAHGGELNPALVRQALRRAADDLGPPGRDAFYGFGRVNAEDLGPPEDEDRDCERDEIEAGGRPDRGRDCGRPDDVPGRPGRGARNDRTRVGVFGP